MTIWENGNYISENIFKVYSGETEYKHVSEWKAGFTSYFEANLNIDGKEIKKTFDNVKDAAKYVDLELIKAGKSPVNLLKAVK